MTGRGRSDYSTDAGSTAVGDESTYNSAYQSESQQSSELPKYATHKPSRAKKANINISGLNRRLRTEFIDVDPSDESFSASLIRGMVGLVGTCFTPRQILVALRLLKAITVSFIALTVAANLVFISCVEFVADSYADNQYFGSRRDTILRLYGLALAVLALLIELDKFVMKNFKVLKGFLARFCLLFFVSTVTYCHPAQYDNYGGGVPTSALVFQMVSSCVLAICSFAYLIFGLLCFDRFTSRAFLSTADPVASTSIPSKYDAPNLA